MNNASQLVRPEDMGAETIHPNDVKIFQQSTFAGVTIEKMHPHNPKDTRRGLVARVNEHVANGHAISITTATYSLATLEKYGHHQLEMIRAELDKAHAAQRRPNSAASLANARTPVIGTTSKAAATAHDGARRALSHSANIHAPVAQNHHTPNHHSAVATLSA